MPRVGNSEWTEKGWITKGGGQKKQKDDSEPRGVECKYEQKGKGWGLGEEEEEEEEE